jgi:hypothetical protein
MNPLHKLTDSLVDLIDNWKCEKMELYLIIGMDNMLSRKPNCKIDMIIVTIPTINDSSSTYLSIHHNTD